MSEKKIPTIEKLTPEQIAAYPKYVKMATDIALKTNVEFDKPKIMSLVNKHREYCKLRPLKENEFFWELSPISAIKNHKDKQLSYNNSMYGNQDINWLITYLFFRCEVGVDKDGISLIDVTEPVSPMLELSKMIHWWWLSDDFAVITKIPKVMKTILRKSRTYDPNQIGSLEFVPVSHSVDSMAIEYDDGYGIYSLFGVTIPSEYHWVIKDRGNYTIKDVIANIKNTEIKTLVMKTMDREELKTIGKIISSHDCEVGGHYDLYQVEFEESANQVSHHRLYLCGNCPSSGKMFFEPVHPDCKTSLQALKWREYDSDDPISDYTPPLVRT